jgi:putative flippase GtrA
MNKRMERDSQMEVSERFMSQEITQAMPVISPRSIVTHVVETPAQHMQHHRPSYHPTGWAFADRVFAIIDQLTDGRADWFQRLFSFLLVGGFAAIVNLLCFSTVYYHILRSVHGLTPYLIAFMVATEVSIFANFIPNDRLTFRHLSGHHRSWGTRCARFHMTSIGGVLLTFGISFSLLRLLHVPAIVAQAAALILATAFNFAFHHVFTYRRVHHTVH